MKKKIKRMYFSFLLGILFLYYLSGTVIDAKEREIYVGDIVVLEISNMKLSEEEIREAFFAFEVLKIEIEEEKAKIEMRIFTPGKYEVWLGNQPITIVVSSTLDGSEEDIRDEMLEIKIPKNMDFLYQIAGIMGILLIVMLLIRFLPRRKKKEKKRTPREQFLYEIEQVNPHDEKALGSWSISLKRYMETVFQVEIMGKTTEEIQDIMVKQSRESEVGREIIGWLMTSDIYKYRKEPIAYEVGEEMLQRLYDIDKKLIDIEVKGEEV